MSNMLKSLYFTCIFCHNSTHSGIMVSDGPGEAQVRCGLQRIFASIVTNNPGRKDCANKPEQIQQPYWRSQPNSCGQRAIARCDLARE